MASNWQSVVFMQPYCWHSLSLVLSLLTQKHWHTYQQFSSRGSKHQMPTITTAESLTLHLRLLHGCQEPNHLNQHPLSPRFCIYTKLQLGVKDNQKCPDWNLTTSLNIHPSCHILTIKLGMTTAQRLHFLLYKLCVMCGYLPTMLTDLSTWEMHVEEFLNVKMPSPNSSSYNFVCHRFFLEDSTEQNVQCVKEPYEQ